MLSVWQAPQSWVGSALPLHLTLRTGTTGMEMLQTLPAGPKKWEETLSFMSFGAGSLVSQYQPMDMKFGVGLGWFKTMPLIQDSGICPGTPCKAQVGMRTNSQAPLQRLSDVLGGPSSCQDRTKGNRFSYLGGGVGRNVCPCHRQPNMASVEEKFPRREKRKATLRLE